MQFVCYAVGPMINGSSVNRLRDDAVHILGFGRKKTVWNVFSQQELLPLTSCKSSHGTHHHQACWYWLAAMPDRLLSLQMCKATTFLKMTLLLQVYCGLMINVHFWTPPLIYNRPGFLTPYRGNFFFRWCCYSISGDIRFPSSIGKQISPQICCLWKKED